MKCRFDSSDIYCIMIFIFFIKHNIYEAKRKMEKMAESRQYFSSSSHIMNDKVGNSSKT